MKNLKILIEDGIATVVEVIEDRDEGGYYIKKTDGETYTTEEDDLLFDMPPQVTATNMLDYKLPEWCEYAINSIDDGFYRETFHSADALNRIEFFLEKWKKEVQNIKKLIAEEPYFLKKNGMYYAHNDCGYVSNPLMAEIYTKEDALKSAKQSNGDIVAIPFSETGYTKDHINAYLARIDKMYAFADSPDRAT